MKAAKKPGSRGLGIADCDSERSKEPSQLAYLIAFHLIRRMSE